MVITVLIITYAALIFTYIKYERMKRERDVLKAREKVFHQSIYHNLDMWNGEK